MTVEQMDTCDAKVILKGITLWRIVHSMKIHVVVGEGLKFI